MRDVLVSKADDAIPLLASTVLCAEVATVSKIIIIGICINATI